jgi:hypothetical protein
MADHMPQIPVSRQGGGTENQSQSSVREMAFLEEARKPKSMLRKAAGTVMVDLGVMGQEAKCSVPLL